MTARELREEGHRLSAMDDRARRLRERWRSATLAHKGYYEHVGDQFEAACRDVVENHADLWLYFVCIEQQRQAITDHQ